MSCVILHFKIKNLCEYKHISSQPFILTQILIDKEELLDYIIDDICDKALCNQTRIQQFEMMDILQAFAKWLCVIKMCRKRKKIKNDWVSNDPNNKTMASKETSNKRYFNYGWYDHLSNKRPSKECGLWSVSSVVSTSISRLSAQKNWFRKTVEQYRDQDDVNVLKK